ncbi:hypothetical protein BLOT_008912 [Blomia tropicalis]|nr:hypothetical protein BLOT_008912 [Blomia tropicalis]
MNFNRARNSAFMKNIQYNGVRRILHSSGTIKRCFPLLPIVGIVGCRMINIELVANDLNVKRNGLQSNQNQQNGFPS